MKSYIHLYTGNGKGKTTAAIGLAVRAAGQGKKVLFLSFLKDGKLICGEEKIFKKIPGVKYIKFREKSPAIQKNTDISKLKKTISRDYKKAVSLINSCRYSLVILDEFTYILGYKVIGTEEFIKVLKNSPKETEIVITGRGASKALVNAADLVTEMNEIKNYYKKGVKARKGIEY